MKKNKPRERMAVTSSLNTIQISPRTPKTPQPDIGRDEDDVELSLLNEAERLQSARAFPEEARSLSDTEPDTKRNISAKDKREMVLLCVLCEYI
jgi:PAT family acetyl-CoA transporter-like MFS transporter 1